MFATITHGESLHRKLKRVPMHPKSRGSQLIFLTKLASQNLLLKDRHSRLITKR